MKDNVIKFPGTVKQEPEPTPEDLKMRFVIGDQDYFVTSSTRPTMFHEEWSVFNLNGRTHVMGETYWAPLNVSGNSKLGDAIQGFFPLDKLSLEILDQDNVLVDWWEFKDVFLSTESDDDELVIHFREATKREFVGNSS